MAEVRQRAWPVPGPAHTFADGDIARSPRVCRAWCEQPLSGVSALLSRSAETRQSTPSVIRAEPTSPLGSLWGAAHIHPRAETECMHGCP